MRACLLFGVIVSAALCMVTSRAYARFDAYIIGFAQGVAVWALLALVARAAWQHIRQHQQRAS